MDRFRTRVLPEKGFDNEPVRCANCRALKKSRMNDSRGGGGMGAGPRQSFELHARSAAKPIQCHLNQKAIDRSFAEIASEAKEASFLVTSY